MPTPGRPARNLPFGAGFRTLVRRPLGLIALALAGAASGCVGVGLGVGVAAAAGTGGVPSTTVVATTPTSSTTPQTGTPVTGTTTTPQTGTPVTGTTTPQTGTPVTGTTTPQTGTPVTGTTTPPATLTVPETNPFTGRGMWIWELSQTDGGDIAAIIDTAEHYGIGTLLVKSSDGTTAWSQFNARLVTDLHEAGLKVCAWQFVYGEHPAPEARLGARAVRDGADCLVIDAESAYQGRYVAASTYMTTLRRLIGKRFPLGLAGFPYVDYHLNFPYSVFLGPDGAQYNLPQMYWADIGVSVSTVFEHTYEWNEIYQRPIYPLGQLFGKLSATAIEQFSLLATDYGATGLSWWDWQSAKPAYFADIDQKTARPYGMMLDRPAVTISKGRGDPVLWAQEHLYSAGFHVALDGRFDAATRAAVAAFQTAHALPASGTVTAATWTALDQYAAVSVRWVQRGHTAVAVVSSP